MVFQTLPTLFGTYLCIFYTRAQQLFQSCTVQFVFFECSTDVAMGSNSSEQIENIDQTKMSDSKVIELGAKIRNFDIDLGRTSIPGYLATRMMGPRTFMPHRRAIRHITDNHRTTNMPANIEMLAIKIDNECEIRSVKLYNTLRRIRQKMPVWNGRNRSSMPIPQLSLATEEAEDEEDVQEARARHIWRWNRPAPTERSYLDYLRENEELKKYRTTLN